MYGNSNRNNYYVSLNYMDQPGIQIGSAFKRYQIKANLDQKIGDFLETGASLTAGYTDRENPRAKAFKSRNIPTAPIYKEDGTFFRVDQINGGTYNNPVAEDELIMDNTYTYNVIGNSYIQLNLLEGLSLKSTLGIDFIINKKNRYVSGQIPTNFEAEKGGEATINTMFSKSILNENTLNYIKTIGDHSFTFLCGWTFQDYDFEGLSASASGFTNDVTTYNAIETGDPAQLKASSSETKWTLLSGLYRMNYSYQGKYLVTISNRHDGSSRLAAGQKWQMFPSAALAWRVSEEGFMQESELISNLKLRASYGKTGSQSIKPYETLSKFDPGFNYLGGKQVVIMTPGLAASKDLTWEKTDQYDIGLELGLFDNKFNIEMDFYYKKTTDLLLERELAYQTGFRSRLENVGSLSNKGFDINLNGNIIRNKDFSWFSSLTLSSNKNEVLELAGGKTFIENGEGSRIIVGEPVGIFYGVKYLGVWQADDPDLGENVPGSPKWEELKVDGIIDQNDGQIIGNAIPIFYGGLNNVLSYKNFSASMFFDFSYGNDIYDLDGGNYNTGHITNVYGKFKNRWTPENTDTNIPRAGAQYFGGFLYGNYAASIGGKGNDFFVSDGSFVRLKNLNVQYDFPIKSNIIKKLNLYGSATNLFTITKYEGYSPDVNSEGTHATRRGFDQNTYPPARVIIIGIKADF
jgi:TonB-dependent starch-binding outer membrane protein SusC